MSVSAIDPSEVRNEAVELIKGPVNSNTIARAEILLGKLNDIKRKHPGLSGPAENLKSQLKAAFPQAVEP